MRKKLNSIRVLFSLLALFFTGPVLAQDIIQPASAGPEVWQIAALLGVGLFFVFMFVWSFGFLGGKKYREERFVFRHSLLTSRMILAFGSIAYPFLNYINYITDDRIVESQIWFPVTTGILMIGLVAASFKWEKLKPYMPLAVLAFYVLVLFHVSLITLVNDVLPIHVIGLCLVISLSSIVIDNPFKLLLSGVVFVSVMMVLVFYLSDTVIDKTQLVSSIFTALLIAFLLSVTKRSLNARLTLGSDVLNDIHNVIMLIDRGGNVQYVNKGAKRMFGLPRRRFLGMGWWQMSNLSSTDPEVVFEHVSDLYDNFNHHRTSRERNGDGKDLFIRWNYQKLENGWLAMIGEDVTEQIKIEQELQKLSIVAKYSEVAILISDKNSKVEWVNSKCEEMTGYSMSDFLGKRPAEILAGPGTDMQVVDKTRDIDTIKGGRRFEVLNYRKNGERFWVSVVNSPIYNEQGEIEQIVEIAQDITDRKNREEREKFEARMNGLLNKIDVALLKNTDWNEAMKQVLNLLTEDFTETNKCAFYEFDGEFVLEHSNAVEGLPRLTLEDSQSILGIRRFMFGPRLIYNQVENEPWAESVQKALGVSNASNFIFYQIREKGNLLGYFAVSSEDQNFIRPEIISYFGKFVEHINLKLVEFLGATRLSSLNKKLFYINELSTAVMNGENIGQKTEEMLKEVVGESLLHANILLYDFEKNMAEYFHAYEGQGATYKKEFTLDNISELAMNALKRNQYFAIENLNKRKNLSASDIKMMEVGIVSFVMFPLFQEQKLFGSLNISMSKPLSHLDQGLASFVNDLTEELSVSIFQKVLQEQTIRDKQQIESLHKDIQASVRSASRIQGSILPKLTLFEELFEDSFVLYEPKDVVSGDFYYLEKVNGKIYVAAADCTGHGVPGALVSMVCKNALNKSILEKKLTDPAKILKQTRRFIIEQFGSGDDVDEGMDIALCIIDPEKQICEFAGAHNPLWILKSKKNELIEIKGDKVGVNKLYEGLDFTTHVVPFDEGDRFYIFSDGFADQFGGDRYRKIGPQGMRKMIKESFFMDFDDQQKYFHKVFNAWKGKEDQIDDVCMIGFKL